MGNFSRNTFDPAKRYVSVRLQQGVPLVDADWNELSDVTRQEAYRSAELGVPDGGESEFPFASGGPNNPVNFGGSGCIDGRRFDVGLVQYETQPWRDPARAAADGVPVIPPLTTPTANRTDMCYLDVWEREVGRAEDPTIVNPAIGVETSVRLRREVAMRVAEGTTTIPPAPSGHRHIPLARFNRVAGIDTITSPQRQPLLPRLNVAAFLPVFEPYAIGTPASLTPFSPWRLLLDNVGRLQAVRNPSTSEADGVLPLQLPSGARMVRFRVIGHNEGRIEFRLARWSLDPANPQRTFVGDEIVPPPFPPVAGGGDFDRTFELPTAPLGPELAVIDNGRYEYGLFAHSGNFGATDLIYGITIAYSF
jgi:hypothetical protein